MDNAQPAPKGTRAPSAGKDRLPSPVLVDTPETFDRLLAALAGEPSVALDTESDSLYRYFYRVCLIQISVPAADYLLDPLRLPDLAPLGTLLADPSVEKVFHAAENDILVLKRDFHFNFGHVFDTMIAARILGWPRVGLAALLAEHFGVELDKRGQLTDWGQRPLTRQQLDYAGLDSHFLLGLRDLMAHELRSRGRWREAQEAFALLPDITYVERPFDPDGFWRTRGARDLRLAELAVLRELYLWREGQARAADRPPFKILSDQVLIRLSQEQPRRVADLRLGGVQAERYGRPILEAIAAGQGAPAPQPPPRNYGGDHRPDPAVLARYDRLRAWRMQRAAERGVDADVVLTNETLMALARSAPDSLQQLAALDLMGSWKLEEYGADLLQALTAPS